MPFYVEPFKLQLDKFIREDVPTEYLARTKKIVLYMRERLMHYTPIDRNSMGGTGTKGRVYDGQSGKMRTLQHGTKLPYGVRHAWNNWIITIGAEIPIENGKITGPIGNEVSTARAKGDEDYLEEWVGVMPVQARSFHITNMATRIERNNAPFKYMQSLVDGHSKQAPVNFIPIVKAETIRFVQELKAISIEKWMRTGYSKGRAVHATINWDRG